MTDHIPMLGDARRILGPDGILAERLPNYESRTQQLRMTDLIEEVFDSEENAVIEAPTGTGKSLAYLVPAILAAADLPPEYDAEGNPHRRKTVISTADKSLQEQLWRKDVPFLQGALDRSFTVALLKGRSNYLCEAALYEAQHDPHLSGVGFRDPATSERWGEFLTWTEQTKTGDLEELKFTVSADLRQAVTVDSEGCTGSHCDFYGTCWVERAKRQAKAADIVIVNHALLMIDIALRLSSQGAACVLPEADYIVLDEGHAIPEIARNAFGCELTLNGWRRIAREWGKYSSGPHPDTTSAIEVFFDNIEERFDKDSQLLLGDERYLLEETVADLLRDVSFQIENPPVSLTSSAERARWKKLMERIGRYARNLRWAITPPEDEGRIVRYAERSGIGRFQRVVVHVKPIDVSDLLRENLFESESYRSVVSTSATLATEGRSPFAFWKDQVGAWAARERTVKSPFDFTRQGLLYLPPKDRALDPTQGFGENAADYLHDLANECLELVTASRGRAFLLFTSNRVLAEVYQRLVSKLPADYLILRQGDQPRPELVRQFREHGNAVLFGVKSFWQGVDISGAALSLVVIDKLPFIPPGDPIWDARRDAIIRQTGQEWAWFGQLAIPNAIIELKQGLGRLIRSRTDRGVVALLDSRLVSKKYGPQILRALPPFPQTDSLDDVRRFFAGAQ